LVVFLLSGHGKPPPSKSRSLDDDDGMGQLGLGNDGEGMLEPRKDLLFSPIPAAESRIAGPLLPVRASNRG
jgi:hypothetical protein